MGGGKGKGKHLEEMSGQGNRHKNQSSNQNNPPPQEEINYEGALKRNSLVMALSRGSQTEYQLGKIIEIRPAQTGDEEDMQVEKMLLGDKSLANTL